MDNNRNKKIWAKLGTVLLGTFLVSTAKAEEPSSPETVAASTSAPAGEPVYTYKGDRMRDPFVPLAGDKVMVPELSGQMDFAPFNPLNAELKGIVKTPTGRWALLRTTDGGTFVVQNGRIYDPKRKPLGGFQGIVKEKSVVILSPGNNEEIELKLKSGNAPGK